MYKQVLYEEYLSMIMEKKNLILIECFAGKIYAAVMLIYHFALENKKRQISALRTQKSRNIIQAQT